MTWQHFVGLILELTTFLPQQMDPIVYHKHVCLKLKREAFSDDIDPQFIDNEAGYIHMHFEQDGDLYNVDQLKCVQPRFHEQVDRWRLRWKLEGGE